MSIITAIDNDAKKALALAEWVKNELIKAGENAPAILKDIATDSTKVEAFVSTFFPSETRLVDFAVALGPKVGAAIENAAAAAAQNGINVALDGATFTALKAIWVDIESLFTK